MECFPAVLLWWKQNSAVVLWRGGRIQERGFFCLFFKKFDDVQVLICFSASATRLMPDFVKVLPYLCRGGVFS